MVVPWLHSLCGAFVLLALLPTLSVSVPVQDLIDKLEKKLQFEKANWNRTVLMQAHDLADAFQSANSVMDDFANKLKTIDTTVTNYQMSDTGYDPAVFEQLYGEFEKTKIADITVGVWGALTGIIPKVGGAMSASGGVVKDVLMLSGVLKTADSEAIKQTEETQKDIKTVNDNLKKLAKQAAENTGKTLEALSVLQKNQQVIHRLLIMGIADLQARTINVASKVDKLQQSLEEMGKQLKLNIKANSFATAVNKELSELRVATKGFDEFCGRLLKSLISKQDVENAQNICKRVDTLIARVLDMVKNSIQGTFKEYVMTVAPQMTRMFIYRVSIDLFRGLMLSMQCQGLSGLRDEKKVAQRIAEEHSKMTKTIVYLHELQYNAYLEYNYYIGKPPHVGADHMSPNEEQRDYEFILSPEVRTNITSETRYDEFGTAKQGHKTIVDVACPHGNSEYCVAYFPHASLRYKTDLLIGWTGGNWDGRRTYCKLSDRIDEELNGIKFKEEETVYMDGYYHLMDVLCDKYKYRKVECDADFCTREPKLEFKIQGYPVEPTICKALGRKEQKVTASESMEVRACASQYSVEGSLSSKTGQIQCKFVGEYSTANANGGCSNQQGDLYYNCANKKLKRQLKYFHVNPELMPDLYHSLRQDKQIIVEIDKYSFNATMEHGHSGGLKTSKLGSHIKKKLTRSYYPTKLAIDWEIAIPPVSLGGTVYTIGENAEKAEHIIPRRKDTELYFARVTLPPQKLKEN